MDNLLSLQFLLCSVIVIALNCQHSHGENPCYTVDLVCTGLQTPEANHEMRFRARLRNNQQTCRARLQDQFSKEIGGSITSPRFISQRKYINNRISKYNFGCTDPNAFLHLILTRGYDIEPKNNCPNFIEPKCVDQLILNVFGGEEPMCGTREAMVLLPESALRNLLVTFQTNGAEQRCGFNINIYCVPILYFDSESCVIPPGDTYRRGRRSAENLTPEIPVYRQREKRWFRNPYIFISDLAYVTYSDFTVRVATQDGRWLYKFRGIRVFQVFNLWELYRTFQRDGPTGRRWPGRGWLLIGNGIVMFQQDGAPSQLRPSLAETGIILRLQNEINSIRTENDTDSGSGMAGPPGPDPDCRTSPISSDEQRRNREDAEFYGNACTGSLRAVACMHQSTFRKFNLTRGCLELKELRGTKVP